MSVSAIEAGVIRIGNGATTVFSFSFEGRNTSDIKISNIVNNTLVPVLSGFVATLNLDGSGGDVTFAVAPIDGLQFYIYRDTSATQLVSVSSQSRYDPQVVEGVWDKLTFLVQELEAEIDRSVKTVPGVSSEILVTSIFTAEQNAVAAAIDAATSESNASASAIAAAISAAEAALAADRRQFPDISAFETAVAGGYTSPTGITSTAGGKPFVKVASGGVIPSLPNWASARSIIVGETHIDVCDAYNIIGNDGGDHAKLQSAFDTAPIGCTLHFKPGIAISTTTGWKMTRMMDLSMASGGAGSTVLRGDFVGALDVLQVEIREPAMNGDVRNMSITGGQIYCSTGGNCALNINPTEDGLNLPQFGLTISRGLYIGRLRSIRLGAARVTGDNNFNSITDNQIFIQDEEGSAVDLAGCADGNRIFNNLIFGSGRAIRVDLERGAYNTSISDNGIVTTNGGIVVANGDRIMIDNNQFEHPSATVRVAHIEVQSLAHTCIGPIITRNNFGAGAGINFAIYANDMQQAVIDDNYFFTTTTGQDIAFIGSSYNHLGLNQIRGIRAKRAAPTDVTRRLGVTIDAASFGNTGVWQAPTFANGWTSGAGAAAFEVLASKTGRLEFAGQMEPGTLVAGTLAATLPGGHKAQSYTHVPYVDNAGVVRYMSVDAAGDVRVGSAIAANPIYAGGWSVVGAALDNAYDTGA